uniref:Uncharacterized protein n=1 Tax=Romanomermis culicivorax TaxID=13658 RepID=A0A915JKZ2_ROMCU
MTPPAPLWDTEGPFGNPIGLPPFRGPPSQKTEMKPKINEGEVVDKTTSDKQPHVTFLESNFDWDW